MPEVDPDVEELAKAAYEAWINRDGVFATWEELPGLYPWVSSQWRSVARAVRDRLCQQSARDNLPARRPKCRDCRWWEWRKRDATERGQKLGVCIREGLSGGPIYMLAGCTDNDGTYLETTEDFGCILWKAKDGVPTFNGIPIKEQP